VLIEMSEAYVAMAQRRIADDAPLFTASTSAVEGGLPVTAVTG
jgi:hypothetical protein